MRTGSAGLGSRSTNASAAALRDLAAVDVPAALELLPYI
jgi:hypothetical protein